MKFRKTFQVKKQEVASVLPQIQRLTDVMLAEDDTCELQVVISSDSLETVRGPRGSETTTTTRPPKAAPEK